MPEDPQPVYTVREQGGRQLVTCTLGEFVGSARVFSTGMADAEARALAQAEDKKAKVEA